MSNRIYLSFTSCKSWTYSMYAGSTCDNMNLPYWLLLKIWLKIGFKPVQYQFWLNPFVLWLIYFCLLKELWCRYFRFSKIWILFPQLLWQHCLPFESTAHRQDFEWTPPRRINVDCRRRSLHLRETFRRNLRRFRWIPARKVSFVSTNFRTWTSWSRSRTDGQGSGTGPRNPCLEYAAI